MVVTAGGHATLGEWEVRMRRNVAVFGDLGSTWWFGAAPDLGCHASNRLGTQSLVRQGPLRRERGTTASLPRLPLPQAERLGCIRQSRIRQRLQSLSQTRLQRRTMEGVTLITAVAQEREHRVGEHHHGQKD